jgi:hypothetical protein
VTQESKNQRLHRLLGRHWHEGKREVSQATNFGTSFRYACYCGATSDFQFINPDYTGSIQDALEAVESIREKDFYFRISDSRPPYVWNVSIDKGGGDYREISHAENESLPTALTDAMIAALSQEEKK